MERDNLIIFLQYKKACGPAMEWVCATEGAPYDLWRRCERGDWLVWLAAEAGVDQSLCATAAVALARAVLPVFEAACPGDSRPRRAVEFAEARLRGEDVSDAALRRRAADSCAAAAYASYAAGAGSHAYAAGAAAAHASYAVCAAGAGGSGVGGGFSHAADPAGAAEHARIVRRTIPWRLVRDALDRMHI